MILGVNQKSSYENYKQIPRQCIYLLTAGILQLEIKDRAQQLGQKLLHFSL
jgi:hypothetical protein